MKRKLFVMFMLAVLFALSSTAVSANAISVTVNGQPVVFADQNPVVVDGRTLVPIAGVFQALGYDVAWDGEARQATISGRDIIIITIDSYVFTVNGMISNLDVPAQIIGGRTMLPIAVVLRSIHYEVDWDVETSTVAITSPAPIVVPVHPPLPEVDPLLPEQDLDDEDELIDDELADEDESEYEFDVNNVPNEIISDVNITDNDLLNSPGYRPVWTANLNSIVIHRTPECSNMRSPVETTKEAALARPNGGRPCMTCWINRGE